MRLPANKQIPWIVCLAAVLFSGCINPSRQFLRSDYVEYDKFYAEASDKQMLLNLARLANDDPVYFMQLSGISSEYQASYSAGMNPSFVRNYPGKYQSMNTVTKGGVPSSGASTVTTGLGEYTKDAFTLGGSLNTGITETPIFQFVPLTGSNVVNAVMNPISSNVFFLLFDQGYPADVLARLMVRTVREHDGDTTTSNLQVSFQSSATNKLQFETNLSLNQELIAVTNDSSNVFYTVGPNVGFVTNLIVPNKFLSTNWVSKTEPKYHYLVNSPRDPTYPDFLHFCQKLRQAQQYHALIVGSKTNGGHVAFSGSNLHLAEPRLGEIVSAVLSNLDLKIDSNSLTITKQGRPEIGWILNTNSRFLDLTTLVFTNYPDYKQYARIHGGDKSNSVSNLTANFVSTLNKFSSELYSGGRDLNMLTVEGAMYVAGREERYFRDYAKTDMPQTYYSNLVYFSGRTGPYAFVTTNVPAHPRFKWDDFNDFHAFTNRLYGGADRVSKRLASWTAPPGASFRALGDDALKFELSEWLNGLVSTNMPLYDPHHFLAEADALAHYPEDLDAHKINYVLLLDAYSSELKPPPDLLVRPLLRLTCEKSEEMPAHKLAEIEYPFSDRSPPQPTRYFLGDNEGKYDNRLVFLLLTYLFDQSAVSTTNLPVQQVIHLQ